MKIHSIILFERSSVLGWAWAVTDAVVFTKSCIYHWSLRETASPAHRLFPFYSPVMTHYGGCVVQVFHSENRAYSDWGKLRANWSSIWLKNNQDHLKRWIWEWSSGSGSTWVYSDRNIWLSGETNWFTGSVWIHPKSIFPKGASYTPVRPIHDFSIFFIYIFAAATFSLERLIVWKIHESTNCVQVGLLFFFYSSLLHITDLNSDCTWLDST